MTNFDIILLAVIAIGAVVGLFRGLVKEAVSTFGIFLAAIIANLASPMGEEYLGSWFDRHSSGALLAWVVTFIVALIALFFVSRLVDKMLDGLTLGWVNRLAGCLFGGLKYAFICALAVSALQLICSYIPDLSIASQLAESRVVPVLHDVISIVMPWMSEHILAPALQMLRA